MTKEENAIYKVGFLEYNFSGESKLKNEIAIFSNKDDAIKLVDMFKGTYLENMVGYEKINYDNRPIKDWNIVYINGEKKVQNIVS